MTFDNNVSVGAGSRLQIELGGSPSGTKYDQVRVTGGLSLDGTLSVSLIDGFAPTRGDSFDILDWGSLSGTFHTIQLPALAGELTWNTSQLYVSGRLSVASAGLPGDYNQNSVVDAAGPFDGTRSTVNRRV